MNWLEWKRQKCWQTNQRWYSTVKINGLNQGVMSYKQVQYDHLGGCNPVVDSDWWSLLTCVVVISRVEVRSSEDYYQTGCQNISHCEQQSYSGLQPPGNLIQLTLIKSANPYLLMLTTNPLWCCSQLCTVCLSYQTSCRLLYDVCLSCRSLDNVWWSPLHTGLAIEYILCRYCIDLYYFKSTVTGGEGRCIISCNWTITTNCNTK